MSAMFACGKRRTAVRMRQCLAEIGLGCKIASRCCAAAEFSLAHDEAERKDGRKHGAIGIPSVACLGNAGAFGFIAGFVATLIFHQIGLLVLHFLSITPGMPDNMNPAAVRRAPIHLALILGRGVGDRFRFG
jgi:hypothetical protein